MTSLKDRMNVDELEILYGMVGSLTNVAKYLGVSEAEVRLLKLRSPTARVKSILDKGLVALFLAEGGADQLAKRMYVSPSFILAELSRRGYRPDRPLVAWTALKVDMERLGSVALTAAVYGSGEAEVRRQCKLQGFDPKDVVRLEAAGKYTAALGRNAELAFADWRGDKIVTDCNREEGFKADRDFVDSEFGRVNVKSSKGYRSKRTGKLYFKVNTEGLNSSDHLAAALYDVKREKVLYWWVRPVGLINRRLKTLSIHEGVLTPNEKGEDIILQLAF